MCYVAQVYATPCGWLCRERETAPVAVGTPLRAGTCPEGCSDALRMTWVGYGANVEEERKTTEDYYASVEQVREKRVSCEQEEVKGCNAVGLAGSSGEEEARGTCKNRASGIKF